MSVKLLRCCDFLLGFPKCHTNRFKLVLCSLASKQPDFYEKHFGHISGDDEALKAQGRFTLNGICDVTNDLKDDIYTTGIDKIDNVSYSYFLI